MRVDGVDISHHQGGDIGWAEAKAAGVKWVYHKATEGATVIDGNYDRRRAEARNHGMPFGAYHFARPSGEDAISEARWFLHTADPQPGDLQPCLDIETMGDLSLPGLIRWVQAWCAEVATVSRTTPVIYTPFNLGADVHNGHVIWRPRYNNDNDPPVLAWDIWQFSNGVLGRPNEVAGFGHVDLNTHAPGFDWKQQLLIPKEEDMMIKAMTYNITHKPTNRQAKRFLLDAVEEHDLNVIALQEAVAMIQRGVLEDALPKWDLHGAGPDPILTHPDLNVRFTGRLWLTDKKHVGGPGAGPPTLREKHATVVAVKAPGMRLTWLLNKHDAPSIRIDVRDELHEHQQLRSIQFLDRQHGRALAMGDHNCLWSHENMRPWRQAGYRQFVDRSKGSHHGAIIDYFIGGEDDFRQVRAGTINGLVDGDHDAKWVWLR